MGEEAQTNAAAEAAATALQEAIDEAARLKKECECRVQGEHEAAWTAATSNNDANEKAWTQAHNMLCVLEHTTYENCEVPAVPTVSKPDVDPAVEAADCSNAETEEEGYGSNAEPATC